MRSVLTFCSAILLCCLFLPAIAQTDLKKIYLNPKTLTKEKVSKFVDSIRFIPLEKRDGVELGAYYNIDITPKYFLLNDYLNKSCVVYAKDGQYVKTINYGKLGGSFYPQYNERDNQLTFFGNNKNYTLTAKDQVQIKLDWNNPRNRKYFKKYVIDLDEPTLTLKKDAPTQQDIQRVYHFYDNYFIQGQANTSPLYKDSLDYELKIYKGNELVKTFFPYNRINEPKFLFSEENLGFHKTADPLVHFITRPYTDTIYKMVKEELSPAYQLVLPLENALPASFFTRPFKNRTERENFSRNNAGMFRQVLSFYETPRLIFFGASYFSNYETYIYEKQTQVTYKTKNLRSDSTQYNVPFFADFSIIRKGDKFYKSQKAADLLTFFDKNKTIRVPKELEAFVQQKPAGNTPVIIEFKLKN